MSMDSTPKTTMDYVNEVVLILLLVLVSKGTGVSGDDNNPLVFDYYKDTCPLVEEIVRHNVRVAVFNNPRMAASLLRLHFHDCFVMGCDGSVLLESNGGMISEKQAVPNLNSLHGFEVIDKIKNDLEKACPLTVSCADILAIAARDSVALRGGPRWKVLLGRKDSLKASLDGANQFLPAPNSSLQALIANFNQQGLSIQDLVALSGSHTMGKARCISFRQRVHDQHNKEYLDIITHDKYKRYNTFRRILSSICPRTGNDEELAPLDYETPAKFDNNYFINILEGRGLLGSDNVLVTEDHEGEIVKLVWDFASNQKHFFDSYVRSMINLGNINVITGNAGEIRKNCRLVNA